MWEIQISKLGQNRKKPRIFLKIENFLNRKISTALLATALYICISSSVVNGLPVCGILFRFGRKNEICKEYLGTGF